MGKKASDGGGADPGATPDLQHGVNPDATDAPPGAAPAADPGMASGEGDFAYPGPSAARAAAGAPAVMIAIYADRAHLRASIRDDARAAGLGVAFAGSLADLLDAGETPHADIVVVDCPQVDAAALAALAMLDLRAARCETRLVVSTSVDALDEVFACMDHSTPTLLVDPGRAERVIALGHALAGLSTARLRDLTDEDRLMLLRLAEQVGQIAGQIDRLSPDGSVRDAEPAFRFGDPDEGGLADGLADARRRRGRPSLPDAAKVRAIIRQRHRRGRYFDAGLFADPAWDMLLDLAAARVEQKRVSVSSLCIASGVPPTTALRWIGQMVSAGLFMRVCDDRDRRRAFIELTEPAAEAMARYFSEVM